MVGLLDDLATSPGADVLGAEKSQGKRCVMWDVTATPRVSEVQAQYLGKLDRYTGKSRPRYASVSTGNYRSGFR